MEDIIQLVVMDYEMFPDGWFEDTIFYDLLRLTPCRGYTGRRGTAEKDPLYGFTRHRELYFKADPDYNGRFTVPVLWDKKLETVVNNESAEIIRMFYSAFDSLLPPERQAKGQPSGGYLPSDLASEIEAMNDWIYNGNISAPITPHPNLIKPQDINNGVYKTGFASKQEAYEENIDKLFAALDRLEDHITSHEGPFLFGKHVTEADIRLFPTIIRFDVAYHTMFRCNLKMIRHDYPHLDKWLRHCYYDESDETRGAFRKTTYFDHVSTSQ